jgi:hypothetical protein
MEREHPEAAKAEELIRYEIGVSHDGDIHTGALRTGSHDNLMTAVVRPLGSSLVSGDSLTLDHSQQSTGSSL